MITNTKTKIEVLGGCSTPDEYKRIADAAKKLLLTPKKDKSKKRQAVKEAAPNAR